MCALSTFIWPTSRDVCMRKNVRLCQTRETVLRDNLMRLGVCVCGEWHRQSKGRAEDRTSWQNSAAVNP